MCIYTLIYVTCRWGGCKYAKCSIFILCVDYKVLNMTNRKKFHTVKNTFNYLKRINFKMGQFDPQK